MVVCLSKNLKNICCCGRRIQILYSKFCFGTNRNQICNKSVPQYNSNLQIYQNDLSLDTKILKTAIIGVPNAGKSTLINQIVGRRIFAISKKVHTTQCRAKAVYVIDKTQLVFLDTPGLVTYEETVRHNLEKSYMTDGENAIEDADVVGVIHDVSNTFTRGKLDPKVLRLLHLYPKKNTVLILNKIDTLKKKRTLLDLADTLTCRTLSNTVYEDNIRKSVQISELELEKKIKNQSGWPGFQEVFMISAIEGFGIGDLVEYLLHMARPGPWLHSEDKFTDKRPRKIIEEAVRSKLLDYLPQEIPYNVKITLEYLDSKEGNMIVMVTVLCQNPRIEKLIRGGKDGKIKIITKETEDDLKSTFQQNVTLTIAVKSKQVLS